ncbi:MAG: response regulator transcription factor [Bernardetiaceae bacterium]|nr:response regulator transcription factor [Bernardetiaceae bacterium]
MIKVLLAEDDHNLGEILKEYLDLKEYDVTLCRDGKEALDTFIAHKDHPFELCIFDVMMPIMDGFTLAKEVRSQNKSVPIIFLTARSMKEDKIKGLEIGADDYLTKPFSMEELLLRVKAILRRTTNVTSGGAPLRKFQIGSFLFDYDAQALKDEKEEQHLTSKESELLRMLCENKNQTLERSEALTEIWGDDNYFNARSMDVYITKLRKYLRSDERLRIVNVHGTGFKLVELDD